MRHRLDPVHFGADGQEASTDHLGSQDHIAETESNDHVDCGHDDDHNGRPHHVKFDDSAKLGRIDSCRDQSRRRRWCQRHIPDVGDHNNSTMTAASPGPAQTPSHSRSDSQSDALASLTPATLAVARAATGFMPDNEGIALHLAAMTVAHDGPMLEIGAYCGKSGIYLGAAAEFTGSILFSVDHHRGSEENQAGWEHHDSALVDPTTGRMDTLPVFRRTIEAAGLEPYVIAIVGSSPIIASHWNTPLALCFIDGGHGREVAHADFDGWAHHVAPGGLLAIHDVFPDPADGGTPPYEIYLRALASKVFDPVDELSVGSLRILRRR
jgi:MMP 1-O-methyltransferase